VLFAAPSGDSGRYRGLWRVAEVHCAQCTVLGGGPMTECRVLDLFCGLGGFSAAFEDSERWQVTTVDIEDRFEPDICADVFGLRPSDFEQDFDVILASPPCQYLATAGNHDCWDFERKVPTAPESQNAVALVHHTLGLIHALAPTYWYVENPYRSRIQWSIGPPDQWVTYCRYGTDYQKPTALWGEHAPMTFRRCRADANCHVSNTEDDGNEAINSMNDLSHAERAKVPYQLSKSIRDACERALNGEVAEQVELGEVVG